MMKNIFVVGRGSQRIALLIATVLCGGLIGGLIGETNGWSQENQSAVSQTGDQRYRVYVNGIT